MPTTDRDDDAEYDGDDVDDDDTGDGDRHGYIEDEAYSEPSINPSHSNDDGGYDGDDYDGGDDVMTMMMVVMIS